MKAKIKETKKDINIDIVIENNVLSKNKYNIPKKQNDDNIIKKKPASTLTGNDSSSVPKLVSEYLGIMASRDLYNMNRVQQPPFNFQQFLPPSNANVPMLQNYNYPMISEPQTNPDIVSDDEEEELEDIGEGEAIPSIDEGGEEVPVAPSAAPSAPPSAASSSSAVPTAAAITKQQLLRAVLDPEKEDAFVNQNKNKANWVKNRNNYIDMITDRNARIQLKRNTVLEYKLGTYLRDFRPEYWKKMLNKSN